MANLKNTSKAKEKADSNNMKVVGEQLQQEIDKIWLEAQYALAGYNKTLTAAKQLELLQKIKESADKLGKEHHAKTLEQEIDAIWLKGYQCQVAGITDVKELQKMPLLKRFDVLETVLRAAMERKIQADIDAVTAEMNPLWMDAQLCKVAKIPEIALFTDLELELQFAVLSEVSKRATDEKREAERKRIEERMSFVKYNLTLAQALNVKTQAEILKTSKERQLAAIEAILQDEGIKSDAKAVEYFNSRKTSLEIASNRRLLVGLSTKRLCDLLKQRSPDTLMKEIKCSEQIKAIMKLEAEAGQKGDAEIAGYFHDCVITDGLILQLLENAMKTFNKNKKEAEDKPKPGADGTSLVQRGGARQRYRFTGNNPEEKFMNLEPLDKAEVLRLIQELADKELQAGKISPKMHRDVLLRLHERQSMCLGVNIFISTEALPEIPEAHYKDSKKQIEIVANFAKILSELLAAKVAEKAKMDADAAKASEPLASDPLVFSAAGTQAASAALDEAGDATDLSLTAVLPTEPTAAMTL